MLFIRRNDKELFDLYSPNIIRVIKSRRMRWAGHVARMEERISAYRVLVGRREGEISLGRPMFKWEYNIRMGRQEVSLVAWTVLMWHRIWTGGRLL